MQESILKKIDTVSRFLEMNISKEDELQQIVELAANICDVPIAMITFMDGTTQHIKFKVGTDVCEIPHHDTFCQHTIAQKKLLIIPDTLSDNRVMNNAFVKQAPNVRFYAGSPLTTYDDYNIGTLCVYDFEPRLLTSTQEKMLHRLARQITRLLEFDASLQLLKDQYELSRLEQTKLRSFFESSSSCHLLLDPQLRVLSFNHAIVKALLTHYQLTIAEGMEVIDYVEPSFVEEFTHNCKSALLGEQINVETLISSPNGNIPWHLTYEPAFDSAGSIIGVTYSATDITQMIKHQKTVVEQGESFRQINRIFSELHQPMEVIKDAMTSMRKNGYPDHITELKLLEQVCDQLWEKRVIINVLDKGSVPQ